MFLTLSDWPEETHPLSLRILSLLYGFWGPLENYERSVEVELLLRLEAFGRERVKNKQTE